MQVILIIAVFLVSVLLMYQKKLNTLVGLPALAIVIGLLANIPVISFIPGTDGMQIKGIVTEIIAEGALRLYNPILVIIFGATLAELVKKSGIVEVMIKNTAEFLGDRTFLIAVFLMLIIAVLFTVLAGLGAIVMVGSVVFPIMISLGVSKLLAGCIFLFGLSLGGMLNLTNWALYVEVLKLPQEQIMLYVRHYLPIAVLIAIGFIYIELRREGGSSFRLQIPERKNAVKIHPLAYFTPIIPVLLVVLVALVWKGEFPIITAMFVGILYGTLTAPKAVGPRVRLLTRSIFEGINSVGPAIALMIGIGMLLKAVAHPNVKELLGPMMTMVIPHTGLGYLLLFTLAAPLALYRGPLNLWGMGSGLVVLIKDTNALPAVAIMAALMSVGQIQGISDPTNTYNVWIANYLGVDVIRIMKKSILYAWLIAFAGLLLAVAKYF